MHFALLTTHHSYTTVSLIGFKIKFYSEISLRSPVFEPGSLMSTANVGRIITVLWSGKLSTKHSASSIDYAA